VSLSLHLPGSQQPTVTESESWELCKHLPTFTLLISTLNLRKRIFENSGTEDCLRLLVGNVPQSKTGPALPSSPKSIPLSSHYACLLAELAYQRGFDGYLLNVEINLDGAMEQTQALAAWITLLQSELRTKIGQHAQTIWFASYLIERVSQDLSILLVGMTAWFLRDSYYGKIG